MAAVFVRWRKKLDHGNDPRIVENIAYLNERLSDWIGSDLKDKGLGDG